MRADADPGDSPTTVDNKRCTPREINRVDSDRLIDAVRARHRSRFVEQNRERIGVFLDVFFSAEETIDLLRCNKCDSGVAFFEFLVSRLELSQLIRAVGSPGAADEH